MKFFNQFKFFILFAMLGLMSSFAKAETNNKEKFENGFLVCDDQPIYNNIGYCRLISGGDDAGNLFAINVSTSEKIDVPGDGLAKKITDLAAMRVMEIAADNKRLRLPMCNSITIENGVITNADLGTNTQNCLIRNK